MSAAVSTAAAPGALEFTPSAAIAGIVDETRAAFRTGRSLPVSFRKQQLRQLLLMLSETKPQLTAALAADLRQTPFLADAAEVSLIASEISDAIEQLDEWTRPEARSLPPVQQPGQAYVYREPYGVALIIAPWNYPVRLALAPMWGAIAAGNAVVLKPSEVAPHAAAYLGWALPRYLDAALYRVVQGGPEESTELLRQRFDYIFYTGNTAVGRIVMRAAAEHLTPVTLELGGKSPVLVDRDANLDTAARRIAWGKFSNSGQTCVAPDYVLVHREVRDALVERLRATIRQFYGDDPQRSADYSRIINDRHTLRLQRLLENQRVLLGGRVDVADRYVEPTLLDNPAADSAVMSDEIFGPLLPIIPVPDMQSAVDFVNQRAKPLALYVFSSNKSSVDHIVRHTSSGGVGINETVMHVVCPELPFGGVGPSGMGSYNFRYSFHTFSHEKAVLAKWLTWLDPALRYPPYSPSKQRWFMLLGSLKTPRLSRVLAFAATIGVASFLLYRRFGGGSLW